MVLAAEQVNEDENTSIYHDLPEDKKIPTPVVTTEVLGMTSEDVRVSVSWKMSGDGLYGFKIEKKIEDISEIVATYDAPDQEELDDLEDTIYLDYEVDFDESYTYL